MGQIGLLDIAQQALLPIPLSMSVTLSASQQSYYGFKVYPKSHLFSEAVPHVLFPVSTFSGSAGEYC